MSRNRQSSYAKVVKAASANPYRVLAVGIAVLAGLVVFVIAHTIFPYHSANHDEGVYLQQAAMLLEGRLFLTPGSDVLTAAVRPWFFVDGEAGLYPKYAPVPAAMFAVGLVVGEPRLVLGIIAGINVWLAYVLTVDAFDQRTGVTAAAIVAAAPLFLLASAVFLPYAPTATLNLLFAVAYIRSVRRADPRYAVLAGAAIGLAFFARPFTAVLFATPFVAHALWRLARAYPTEPTTLRRYGLTGGVAAGFVGLALAYNALVTGSPFLFPYEAFAPRDGLGFGRRALLGYELQYTPTLALRANIEVLYRFATDWFAGGAIGVAIALGGGGVALRGIHRHGLDRSARLSPRQLQLVLLGVILVVVAGNILFWGNRNILDDFAIQDDGFISLFGPFYHFDLLAPVAAFAAHGVVTTADGLKKRLPDDTPFARLAVAGLVIVAGSAVVAAEANALGPPLERNAAFTQKYDRAYEPFTETNLSNALVFVPPTYGEWRNHPFQWLRNDPGFDGSTVYVLSRNPAADFAVLDAYPGRSHFRYRYHGEWTSDPNRHVVPVLERVRSVDARAVTARTTVSVPERIVGLDVAVSTNASVHRYDYQGEIPSTFAVEWTVSPQGVTLAQPNLSPRGEQPATPATLDRPQEVVLTITLTEPEGATLTYRETVYVRPSETGIEIVWPPSSSACPLVTDCGMSGTFVPGRPETRPTGTDMNSTLVEVQP